MLRLWVKISVLLIVLFGMSMGAVMSITYIHEQQRLDEIWAFFMEGDCELPCFMGCNI